MDTEPPPVSFSDLRDGRTALQYPAAGEETFRAMLKEYRPWRTIRLMARDAKIDPVRAWTVVKSARIPSWRHLPFMQVSGEKPLGICMAPNLSEGLHRIDRAVGGGAPAAMGAEDGVLHDSDQRRRLHIRSLMDEAAESSIIEGASTTRKKALEMLRAGEKPKDMGEWMVKNNYLAMQRVKELVKAPLSPGMLMELQGILTDNTLADKTARGRFRRPDEQVEVVDTREYKVLHVPPPAEQLKERVEAICRFANQSHTGDDFIHPIIKASILHFMIGYEHPFVDGNGRTARAAFYWFALRHGYSIFEFVSISEIIRRGFAKYPQAYVDTETDDGDLTYFVLYHLGIIEQSLDRLNEHLKNEEGRIERSKQLLRVAADLNVRQRLLLEHGLRHPEAHYTVRSHGNTNGVAPGTARADLDSLVEIGALVTSKRGKQVIYHPSPTLEKRLRKK